MAGTELFILKTPSGTLTSIDPYMEKNEKTRYVHPEPLIKPKDLKVDFIFCTQDHRDHTDPVSLSIVAKYAVNTIFLGLEESAEHLIRLGIEKTGVKDLRPRCTYSFRAFKVMPYYFVGKILNCT